MLKKDLQDTNMYFKTWAMTKNYLKGETEELPLLELK